MPALNFDRGTNCTARLPLYVFAVRAGLDPQVLLRIAGLFAQRDIIPYQLCCRTSAACLLITVEVAIETPAIAQLLLEKLRSIVLVEHASLIEGNC